MSGGVWRVPIVLLALGVLGACQPADEQAAEHYERGLALVADNEPAKATLEFRNALKLKEDYVEALFALGVNEENQGRIREAVQAFLAVTERDRDHVPARIRLAYILLKSGQVEEAAKFADQAQVLAPTEPSALIVKAATELKRGNRNGAVELARDALNHDSKNADALMVLATERLTSADPEGALAYVAMGDIKQTPNLGLQILELAALESVGNQETVEASLISLVEGYQHRAFRDSLIQWYLSKGRLDDAELALRQFASENPDDPAAQLKLAGFLRDNRGLAPAVDHLNALIERGEDTFAFQLAIAELRFAAGQRSEATTHMRRLVAAETDEPQKQDKARLLLARMELVARNWNVAEQLLDLVLDKDGRNVDALTMRASIQIARGNYDEARTALLTAINEAPSSSVLHQMLGECYERNGRVELAEEHYAKAIDLESGSSNAVLRMADFLLRYGRAEPAERLLHNARDAAPDDRQIAVLLARLSLNRGDWSGAEEIARALRSRGEQSEDLDADRILAASLIGRDGYDDGIELLEKAMSASGNDTIVLADLVDAYVRSGMQAIAERLLTSTIQTDIADPRPHILLASVYARTARPELAEASYRNALSADPNDSDGYVALGAFYLSAGRFGDAEKTAREGLKRIENGHPLRLVLAAALEENGDYEAAIAEYETLFAEEPRSNPVANNLASLLSVHRTDQESLDRAYEIAQRFRRSEVPQFIDTLGWILYLRGEFPSALTYLKTAAERLPDASDVQFHLGMVLKQLGQTELAVASLEKAIALASLGDAAHLNQARSALDRLNGPVALPPPEPMPNRTVLNGKSG